VLSAFKQLHLKGESENLWKKRELLTWILNYVGAQLKSDFFSLFFDEHFTKFFQKHELSCSGDDFKQIRGPVGEEFRAIVKDREEGMINHWIREICQAAGELGLDKDLCYLIHDIFMDLALKKMKQANPLFGKMETFLEKLKYASYPEDYDFDNENYRGFLRIVVPMVEESDEEDKKKGSDDEGEGEEEEKDEGEQEKEKPKGERKLVEARMEDKVLLVTPN
jgi:hypothetical protein